MKSCLVEMPSLLLIQDQKGVALKSLMQHPCFRFSLGFSLGGFGSRQRIQGNKHRKMTDTAKKCIRNKPIHFSQQYSGRSRSSISRLNSGISVLEVSFKFPSSTLDTNLNYYPSLPLSFHFKMAGRNVICKYITKNTHIRIRHIIKLLVAYTQISREFNLDLNLQFASNLILRSS